MNSAGPVRWSHLRAFAQSAAHYLVARKEGIADTAQMRLGRVVDALLFGGRKPAVYEAQRRGKAWEEFEAANAGKEIITGKEYDTALHVVDSVLHPRHMHAWDLLRGRRFTEINFRYLDRDCQSHPDVIASNGLSITDLKTSATSDPRRFVNHAKQLGYLGQLAFYEYGVRAAGEGDPQNLYIVVAEIKKPFNVTAFHLTERALEEGRKMVRSFFEQLLACEAANHWPGYVQTVVELDAADDDFELLFEEES